MNVTWNQVSRISASALLASSLAFASGCSDSDSNDDKASASDQAPTGASVTGASIAGPSETGTPAARVDCEAAWKSYVKMNPKGLILGYQITSATKGPDGALINSTISNSESKVVESNDLLVTTSNKIIIPGVPLDPASSTISKITFMEGCGTVDGIDVGDTTITTLEQGAQKITVPAGTFDTNYSKIAITNAAFSTDTIVSSWIMADGSNIQVKSETSSTLAGLGFTNTSLTELVKIVRP